MEKDKPLVIKRGEPPAVSSTWYEVVRREPDDPVMDMSIEAATRRTECR